MWSRLFKISRERKVSYQRQLREMIVSAILDEKLPLEVPLPSSRELAKHLGIEVQILGPSENEVVTTILTRNPGEVVIWIGNSGNLKGIYSLLGGEGAPPINYGDLYIVEVKASGDPVVIKKRYGPS